VKKIEDISPGKMDLERRCPKCGQVIPRGLAQCPRCSVQGSDFWTWRRDTFLLTTCLVLIPLFVITGIAVSLYHDVERGVAQDWYADGLEALRSGRTEAARTDFRTALTYDHDNDFYQLKLTEALMASGQDPEAAIEARTYLQSLRERDPENGEVNLELARLAARDHAVSDALQLYHGAIYGQWDDDPVVRRRAVRLELVKFLLDSGQKASARPELIAMAGDIPPDPALQTKVGNLLLQVGAHEDALKLFHQALAENPHWVPALEGAGECYFQNHDYAMAARYLSPAVRRDPGLKQSAAHLGTAQSVLNLDPFNRHLTNMERARRAARDFSSAVARLKTCAERKKIDLSSEGKGSFAILERQVQHLQPRAKPGFLSADADLLSRVMDAAFEIEQATAQACGEPEGSDLALLLLSREQGEIRP
jgi:tetratricopeptide (TPR) repeat protein